MFKYAHTEKLLSELEHMHCLLEIWRSLHALQEFPPSTELGGWSLNYGPKIKAKLVWMSVVCLSV